MMMRSRCFVQVILASGDESCVFCDLRTCIVLKPPAFKYRRGSRFFGTTPLPKVRGRLNGYDSWTIIFYTDLIFRGYENMCRFKNTVEALGEMTK